MKNTITKTLLIAVVVSVAASFATADTVDLTGQYWFGSLSANVSSNVPWGKRGTVVITGDNWSQDWNDQDGHHTFSSTFTTSVQSDGSINIELSSGAYNVAWNGDVMIHADSAVDADNRLGVDIMVRKATDVQISDVVGGYSFFRHYISWVELKDGVSWGTCSFKSNNTATYNIVQSNGSTESGSSQWALDDINKTINLSEETYPFFLCKDGLIARAPELAEPPYNNAFAYELMVKKTTQTIVPADIAGTYEVRFLETGPGGVPYTCGQGTVIFDANGTFTVDAHYSDGEDDTQGGTFKIGPGNKIIINGAMDGIISPDKNLIFAPERKYKHHPREDTDWIGGLFFVKVLNSTPVFQFGNVSGSKNQNLTITDACGVLVSFSLTGGGYAELTGGANLDRIDLYDTGDKSQLTISTKGKTYTSVGSIICNGPMKGISAKTAKLSGDITIGPSSNPKSAVTITFDEGDDLVIDSKMPVKAISATDWWGSLIAPSLVSITTKNNLKQDKWGYLDIDVDVTGAIGTVSVADALTGSWSCKSVKTITAFEIDAFDLTLSQEPNVKIPTLGTLTVKENFSDSQIVSAGNIGTVAVGSMIDSVCFAGVNNLVDVNAPDGVLDLPQPEDLDLAVTIKSVKINGIKDISPPYFTNSNIAAANILTAYVAYPEYFNSGVPFGICIYYDPKSLTIKDADGTHSWKSNNIGDAVDALDHNGGDMRIRRD